MDIRPATLVREVDGIEPLEEVVNEAKGLTWKYRREHALIRVAPDRLLLVRGGADGIAFEVEGDDVFMEVDGGRVRVVFLAWHTHPRPTGPSDHDRAFLKVLKQGDSVIYEMFAGGEGTRFYPKGGEDAR
jgi:hypothetical protein